MIPFLWLDVVYWLGENATRPRRSVKIGFNSRCAWVDYTATLKRGWESWTRNAKEKREIRR